MTLKARGPSRWRRARLACTVVVLSAAVLAPWPAVVALAAGSVGRGFAVTEEAQRACPASLAGSLSSTGHAGQLITVVAPVAATTTATVELWQRASGAGGCWRRAGGPWVGFIGRGGFSSHHREGDGTTPVGLFGIGAVVYGNAPNPGTRYPYRLLVCGDWWDEDPASPGYNTFQHVPCGQRPPFGGESEALWTESAAYPSFVVVEYNTHPAVAHAGSAIFIHASTGAPSAGCVAISLTDLDLLLRWLQPALSPAVAMGPASELVRL